jgi:hypothetical protein
MKALTIFVLLCASSFCLAAQGRDVVPLRQTEKAPAGKHQATSGSLAQAEADAEASQEKANIPTIPEPDDRGVSQARAEYDEAYWHYQRDAIEHTRKVYAWQHVSSIIIFYVVIFLVLVGVVFSWLQFKAAAYKGESEELDASMKGVKITSSTLGVVILVLSMCFFYLYLRYVYPVNVNEGAHMAAGAEKTADK